MRRGSVLVALAGCGRVAFESLQLATDAAGDSASDGPSTVIDGFDGVDSATLGNGWAEKRPGVFGITSQHVARNDYVKDYRDNVTTRPVEEDLLDVEASIDFTVGHVPPGYPQVLTRIQRGTLATANTLDGYILYIDGGTTVAKITRQAGAVLPPEIAAFTLSPALQVSATYRLRLRSTGTAPVQLDCYVEQQNGTSWVTIGQVSTTDAAAGAWVAPGATGFSAGQPEATGYYTYDNFRRTPL